MTKKWNSRRNGCQQIVIELVHCGSSSILKVRFLGHPVCKPQNNQTLCKPQINQHIIIKNYATLKTINTSSSKAAINNTSSYKTKQSTKLSTVHHPTNRTKNKAGTYHHISTVLWHEQEFFWIALEVCPKSIMRCPKKTLPKHRPVADSQRSKAPSIKPT